MLMCRQLVRVVIGVISVAAFAEADNYEPPRTPWGEPDLQGVWDFRTLTPMERPVEFGEKEVLTPAEAKMLLAKILPPDRKDEPTGVPTQDVEGYNSFWLDAGEKRIIVDGEYRTSIITTPANGRRPELISEWGKAEAQALVDDFTHKHGLVVGRRRAWSVR